MDFDKEQQRLLKLLEEVESDIEFDDNESDGEEDVIETRDEDSESEQELEDNDEEVESEGPFIFGKDKSTKWRKHAPQNKNVRTRAVNLVKHLPGVKRDFMNLKDPVSIWQLFLVKIF